MTLSHAGTVGAFAMTETRVQMASGRYLDSGGKIVPIGSLGWAVASGGAAACATALRALRDAGLPPEGLDPQSWLRGVLAGALAGGGHATKAPDGRDDPAHEDGARVSVVLPVHGRPMLMAADNAEAAWSSVFATAPYGLEPEERDRLLADIVATFRRDAPGPGSLHERIQLAAQFFVRAGHAESISDTLEIGYIMPTPAGPFAGFLRGKAQEIVECPPIDLLGEFGGWCDARTYAEREAAGVVHLRDDGNARETFRYNDGVEGRGLVVGKRSHRELGDGDPVTWDVSYQTPPTVVLSGGVSSRPDSSEPFNHNQPVSREVYATNIDGGGFEVFAKIVQRGSLGSESVAYPTGAITTVGTGAAKTILNFANGLSKANDDAYRSGYAVTLTPANFGDAVSITVAVDVDLGTGASWEERAAFRYDASSIPGKSWPDETLAALLSDLGDTADIRIYVKEKSGNGTFSVDPDTVSWNTSADVSDTATPAGYNVHAEVFGE